MKTMSLRHYWLALTLVGLTFVAPLLVYERLPDIVPIHWNARGEVDGWAPRTWGAFLLPGVSALITAILIAAPRISPRGFEMQAFSRIYAPLVAAVAAVMLYITIVVLQAALGADVSMDRHALAAAGLLIAFIGNYFGKTTRNFFLGIRTPWTLASDEVWERTHRVSGPLFVGGGLALVACGLVGGLPAAVPLTVIAVIVIVPVAYSYAVWRRLERTRPD
jgi:uncharacterized membrane protein